MDKDKDKTIHYNENAQRYAASGKIKRAAERAKEALDDSEQAAKLKEAEEIGKSHSAQR